MLEAYLKIIYAFVCQWFLAKRQAMRVDSYNKNIYILFLYVFHLHIYNSKNDVNEITNKDTSTRIKNKVRDMKALRVREHHQSQMIFNFLATF